jgi:hypothetical protein
MILTAIHCLCQANLGIYASFCLKNTIYYVDMVEQAVAQVIPNLGGQEAAVAGSQAVVFTATDRKLIEERGGRIDRNHSFLDVLKDRPLTPEVENEQTNIKPEIDLKELEGRKREHRQMLKHSPLYTVEEKVEIKNELPDNYEESQPLKPEPETAVLSQNAKIETPRIEEKKVKVKTVVAPENSKSDNPAQALNKLLQEQEQMHSVKSRVKEYHLKRLLTDNEREFRELSDAIRNESLAAVKPAGRAWLEAQLEKITLGAAQYKLRLLKSLQTMELDDEHKKAIKWLEKTIAKLSAA